MPAIIHLVDYDDDKDRTDLVMLLDAYARDPMGGGIGLSESVKADLPDALAQQHGAVSFIARIDHHAVGLLNAFPGFSTFQCKPLYNIHDVAVLPDYRGRGIGKQLLQAIENHARCHNCCKLTLEVLSGNSVARRCYQHFGFADYTLDPESGSALFWEKKLA